MVIRIKHPTKRPNFSIVQLTNDDVEIDIAFSYETPIAYRTDEHNWIVRRNEWGPTTGKHLNSEELRPTMMTQVEGEEFEELLDNALYEVRGGSYETGF